MYFKPPGGSEEDHSKIEKRLSLLDARLCCVPPCLPSVRALAMRPLLGLAILLLVHASAVVEYDAELVPFVCRYYLDSPPVPLVADDKSSAWLRLLVMLPTVCVDVRTHNT